MAEAVGVLLYVAFCILAGVCGSQRRMGFFGTFLVSVVVTPVVVLLVLILTAPSRRAERDRVQKN